MIAARIQMFLFSKKKYGKLILGFALFFFQFFALAQTNIAPSVMAVGDQVYCPLTAIPIVTDFDIVDPDDTEIDAFFIQISTGYQVTLDVLRLEGTHPNIVSSWDVTQGRLSLRGVGGNMIDYTDLIAAVRDVVFESTSQFPTEEKFFSLTVGDANFLPLTGHYYEYVPDIGVPWDEALALADARTYFGLKGYLATITSPEEAQLTGEQAAGAGWIGGTDRGTEGVWMWVTGPENGTVFWNGGVNGSSPNFAFWNLGEPNNVNGVNGIGEDYAHVTAPSVGIPGSWNDLRNEGEAFGDFQPKGYIVEYGGTPGDPIVNLSGTSKITTPRIASTTDATICGNGSLTLSATATLGDVVWFDAENGGNILSTGSDFTTPTLTQSTTFYAYASVNGCLTGTRIAVEATVNPMPIINTAISSSNCDEDGVADGFTDFNLNEITPLIIQGATNLTVTYHLSLADATSNQNAVNPLPFNNSLAGTLFARAENEFGCFEMATINLQVSTTSFPNNFLLELDTCDTDERDGISSFDLTSATNTILAQFPIGQNLSVAYYRNLEDAQLEQQPIQNASSYRNETAFSQLLYVRVESEDNGDCFGIGPHLNLLVNPLVIFDVPTNAIVCSGAPTALAVLNAQDDYDYEWTSENGTVISNQASVTINTGGVYTVVGISNQGCQSLPETIIVPEFSAPNLTPEFIIVDDIGSNNTITILEENNNLGTGDYEYALDNPFGPFQDEPFFENVAPGLHTLYAQDKNGCGLDQIEIGVVGVPNFMTPNNDNINDTFNVLGVSPEFYNEADLFVMDRFGKLLAQISAFGPGWEGTFQGIPLPSSDYWYVLMLTDTNNKLHRRTGHFSLLR